MGPDQETEDLDVEEHEGADEGEGEGEGEGEAKSQTKPDTALEARARSMGWVPLNEFRGNKDRWTNAAEYVRRGEEVVPIVHANMRKVQQKADALTTEVSQLRTQLAAAHESIEALKTLTDKGNLTALKDSRRDLIVQRRKAEKEDNDDLVAELDEKIQDTTALIQKAEGSLEGKANKQQNSSGGTETKEEETPRPMQTPEYKAWAEANPWFGTDDERSDYAAYVLQRMTKTGEAQALGSQTAVLEEVTRRVFKEYPEESPRTSKVEGGRGRRNSTGSGNSRDGGSNHEGEKTYAELPADAKAACQRTAKKVVGKDRAFKNMQEYQTYYAKIYFEANPNG